MIIQSQKTRNSLSLQQIHFKKNHRRGQIVPQPFQDQEYFHKPVTNFYSRRANCIYLQSVNSVTFIYINIVQGDNFPKQYHALNTVFRLFHSNDEFQIFSKKINYDGQNFRAFTRQSFQVLEAAIRKSTIKKQYRKVLNISQKKTYT